MRSNLRLLALAIAFVFACSAYAQTSTKGFNFQGYAIDPDGKALASTGITVKFTLTSTSTSASPFVEEHVLTSDAFGVFHAVVGELDATSNANFAKLDFTKKGDNFTLKVEVKKTSGGTYTIISNEPMKAVPYARKAENGVPVGTIVAFGGDKTKIPEGWLLCDGKAYSSSAYPQLFAVLGTAHGNGSTGTSSTTGDFNVPYTQGLFLRGVADGTTTDPDASTRGANMAGGNTGDKVGSYQYFAVQSHNHTGTTDFDGWHQHQYTSPKVSGTPLWEIMASDTDGSDNGRSKEYPTTDGALASGGTHTHNFTTASTGNAETRPRNLAVYYIIKY